MFAVGPSVAIGAVSANCKFFVPSCRIHFLSLSFSLCFTFYQFLTALFFINFLNLTIVCVANTGPHLSHLQPTRVPRCCLFGLSFFTYRKFTKTHYGCRHQFFFILFALSSFFLFSFLHHAPDYYCLSTCASSSESLSSSSSISSVVCAASRRFSHACLASNSYSNAVHERFSSGSHVGSS